MAGALAVTSASPLALPTPEPVEVSAIEPSPAPPFVSQAGDPVPPNPVVAAPEGTHLGRGGTPFGYTRDLYAYIGRVGPDGDVLYPTLVRDRDGVFTPVLSTRKRPGENVNLLPARERQPIAADVPAVVEPVQPPVRGQVLGFDLAKVPWWVWIGAAAIIGAKVLK